MNSIAELNRIYLTLGSACNFKCRYCIQKCQPRSKEDGHVIHIEKEISPKVIKFIRQAAECRLRIHDSLDVCLFGGEPLLYRRQLKETVTSLGHLPNIKWTVSTNGSLLTDEDVNFFNAHRVRVCISWDGERSALFRGRNVFDDPELVTRFKQIDNICIEAVITAGNLDLYALRNSVRKIFGGKVPVSTLFLNMSSQVPEDVLSYDLGLWRTVCRRMAEAALGQFKSGKITEYRWEAKLYQRYINNWRDAAENRVPFSCHGIEVNRVFMDIGGNIWFCNNHLYKLGSVSDDLVSLTEKSFSIHETLIRKNKLQCLQCKWLSYCRGGCPREQANDRSRRHCEFLGIFFESVSWVISALRLRNAMPSSASGGPASML